MAHTIEIKVRGYHLDVFGHVNNARYLEFLEEARWAAFEENFDFDDWVRKGLIFTVVNININYRRPALLNARLRIETGIGKLGRRSGVIQQTVRLKKSGEVIADAQVTFVLLDTQRQKATLIEGELLESLRAV